MADSVLWTLTHGAETVSITATAEPNGDVTFTYTLMSGVADLIGFYLDFGNDGGPISVLGGGNNMNGSSSNGGETLDGFDHAEIIGTNGGNDPDTTSGTVTLTAAQLAGYGVTSLEQLADAQVGIRAQSVGPDREDSLKLAGTGTFYGEDDGEASLEIEKTGVYIDKNGNGKADVGDIIKYSFTVTNTGDVALTDVFVDDAMVGDVTPDSGDSDGDDAVDTLGIGGSATFWAKYWLTEDDIAAGEVANTAAADSEETDPVEGSTIVDLPQSELKIEKQLWNGVNWVNADQEVELLKPENSMVEYRIILNNSGDTDLTKVRVIDRDLGLKVWVGDMARNTEVVLTSKYHPELFALWDETTVTNTAVAKSAQTEAVADQAIYLGADPGVKFSKVTVDEYGNRGDGITVLEGADVTWEYTVYNKGNVDLDDVTVIDDMGTVETNDDVELTLDPGEVIKAGESRTFTYTGTAIDTGDALSAKYKNTATVHVGYEDTAGNEVEFSRSDMSCYTAIEDAYVTDSSFHEFGSEYQLLFFENHWNGLYSLFGSAPGYVRYNAVLDGDDEVTLRIPFPFVLHGDDPVTAYSGVSVNEGAAKFRLEPGEEVPGWAYDVSYGPHADTNGDDHIGFGDYYEVTVSGLPTDDLGFVSVILDYDLKMSQAWEDEGGDQQGDATNLDDPTGQTDIADNQVYQFLSMVDGEETREIEITSTNVYEPADDNCDWDGKVRLGSEHKDRLKGGDAAEKLRGLEGDDKIFGRKGGDKIFGNEGDDKLFGGNGKDYIAGSAGDDKLQGGNGKDVIYGGLGNDKMWGGRGADTFLFLAGDGQDIIFDFETRRDVIDLKFVDGFDEWQDIADNLSAVDNGVQLVANGIDITFKGVDLGDLGIDNFDL